MLQNLNSQRQLRRSVSRGFPPVRTDWDAYTMRYQDRDVERRFLMWETQHMKVHLIMYALFLFGLLGLHLTACKSKLQWPCGTRRLITCAFVLIWILIVCTLLPLQYNYRFREVICAAHQICTSMLVAAYAQQLGQMHGTSCASGQDPWSKWWMMWCCVLPVLVESIGAKVRLRYQFGLSIIQICIVVWSWYGTELAETLPLPKEWVQCFRYVVMMLSLPTSVLALYEFKMRKWFESTLVRQ